MITTTRHPVQPILSVVWAGFAFAMALTGWGPWRMDVNPTYKAYLGVN